MGRVSSRADDERLLRLVRLRAKYSSVEIADMFGMRPEGVRAATTRVVAADCAESGEPEEKVLAAYPFMTPGDSLMFRGGRRT